MRLVHYTRNVVSDLQEDIFRLSMWLCLFCRLIAGKLADLHYFDVDSVSLVDASGNKQNFEKSLMFIEGLRDTAKHIPNELADPEKNERWGKVI